MIVLICEPVTVVVTQSPAAVVVRLLRLSGFNAAATQAAFLCIVVILPLLRIIMQTPPASSGKMSRFFRTESSPLPCGCVLLRCPRRQQQSHAPPVQSRSVCQQGTVSISGRYCQHAHRPARDVSSDGR